MQRERREKIIKLLVRQGKPPIIAVLSDEDANAAIDQFTSLLYRRLTRQSVDMLLNGNALFSEFGIEDDIDAILDDLRESTAIPEIAHSTKKMIGLLDG